jgi:tRNA1(Val) A37 N6-methylase TrmN6
MSELKPIKRTQKSALSLFHKNSRFVPPEIDELKPSIDVYLLAAAVGDISGISIMELGTGTGPVAFILSVIYPENNITALENNLTLLKYSVAFSKEYKFGSSIKWVLGDVKNIPLKSGIWDWVISNPPYRKEFPPINTKISIRKSNFESTANLSDFVKSACYLAKPDGIILFIMDSFRKTELIDLFKTEKWKCCRLIPIKNNRDGNVIRYLLYFKKGDFENTVEKEPIIITEFSKCLLEYLPKLYEV